MYFTYKPPELPSLGVGRHVDPTKKTHRIPIQNAAGTGEAEKFQCSAIVAGNCRKMNQNKKRIIQDLGFSGDRINPH